MSGDLISNTLLAYKCQSPDCGFYITQEVGIGDYFCPKCKYTTQPLLDYYRLFDLERDFTVEQLKEKYKRLSLKYHPDKSNSELSDDFTVIRKGYEILSDEAERDMYDQELILLEKFIGGEEIPQEIPPREILPGLIIPGLMGILLSGLSFYYTKDYLVTGFVFLVWAAASMIWKDTITRGMIFLGETGIAGAIIYTMYVEKWMEALILGLALLAHLLIKYRRPGKSVSN